MYHTFSPKDKQGILTKKKKKAFRALSGLGQLACCSGSQSDPFSILLIDIRLHKSFSLAQTHHTQSGGHSSGMEQWQTSMERSPWVRSKADVTFASHQWKVAFRALTGAEGAGEMCLASTRT